MNIQFPTIIRCFSIQKLYIWSQERQFQVKLNRSQISKLLKIPFYKHINIKFERNGHLRMFTIFTVQYPQHKNFETFL